MLIWRLYKKLTLVTIISVIISVPFINIVKITDDFTRGNDIMKSLSLTFVSNIVNVIRGIVTFYLQIRSARLLRGLWPPACYMVNFHCGHKTGFLSLVLSPLSLSITSVSDIFNVIRGIVTFKHFPLQIPDLNAVLAIWEVPGLRSEGPNPWVLRLNCFQVMVCFFVFVAGGPSRCQWRWPGRFCRPADLQKVRNRAVFFLNLICCPNLAFFWGKFSGKWRVMTVVWYFWWINIVS